MPKDFMNPDLKINREIESQPTEKAQRMENHILAESFKMGDMDYEKVMRQSKQLESMR